MSVGVFVEAKRAVTVPPTNAQLSHRKKTRTEENNEVNIADEGEVRSQCRNGEWVHMGFHIET